MLCLQLGIPFSSRLWSCDEKEIGVLLVCARSMIALGDNRGYSVLLRCAYWGEEEWRSLLEDQKKMLTVPKKMVQLGFEPEIEFVPFGGIGYTEFKALTKDDSSPVRAAASRVLASDPDPKRGESLVNAVSDKSWIVRKVALDSLARRGDPTVIPQIVPNLEDPKDSVRYTAAAAILHLRQTKK